MQKTVTICDRCGHTEDVEKSIELGDWLIVFTAYRGSRAGSLGENEADLCLFCIYKTLVAHLKNVGRLTTTNEEEEEHG